MGPEAKSDLNYSEPSHIPRDDAEWRSSWGEWASEQPERPPGYYDGYHTGTRKALEYMHGPENNPRHVEKGPKPKTTDSM